MLPRIRKIANELIYGPDVDEKFKVDVSTKTKIAIGNFGFNLSAGIQAAWLMNVYIKIFHIHPFAWGFAWILYFVWNSINDPLVGYLSDRTRTKFGRRIPWLMVSAPLLTLGFILLFFPPVLDPTIAANQWTLFVWLFITLMIYDTAYTIYGLCQGALISELTIEPEERAHINFYAVIGLSIAVAITFVLPFLLIVNEEPYEQNLPVMQAIVIIFAIIGAICVSIMAFSIKERQEFCFAESEMDKMGFSESIKYTIKNKAFIIYVAFAFMIGYVQLAMYSQISFFVQDVLQISGGDIFSSLPVLFFVAAALVGFPLGMVLNQKYGGKKSLIYLSLLVILGLVLLTFSSEIIMANISLFIMGLGYSASTLVIPILICDIVDKDELETGHRREGAYFGSSALFTKPAQSLAAALTGLVLLITNYELAPQSEVAQFGIKLNIGLIPALFLIAGVLILWKFPIDGSTPEYKEMKKQIEILHDKKLEALRKSCEET
jgi:GPH family glycoside/pentoside/hexuronide:cation symporter